MRTTPLLAGLVLSASLLAGCGASDQEEFCEAFEAVGTAPADAGDDTEAAVAALKRAVQELREVGAPGDMSAQAEQGFEVTTRALLDLPDSGDPEALAEANEVLTDVEDRNVTAFGEYVEQTCES